MIVNTETNGKIIFSCDDINIRYKNEVFKWFILDRDNSTKIIKKTIESNNLSNSSNSSNELDEYIKSFTSQRMGITISNIDEHFDFVMENYKFLIADLILEDYEGDISEFSILEKLTLVNCFNITGIEHIKSLKELKIVNNIEQIIINDNLDFNMLEKVSLSVKKEISFLLRLQNLITGYKDNISVDITPFKNVKTLKLKGIDTVENFETLKCTKLTLIECNIVDFSKINFLSNLKELTIINCKYFNDISSISSNETLECFNLYQSQFDINFLELNVKALSIDSCHNIKEINISESVKKLYVNYCNNIQFINFFELDFLAISNLIKLKTYSFTRNVKSISVISMDLIEEDLEYFTNCEKIKLELCDQLTNLSSIYNVPLVIIRNCKKVVKSEELMNKFTGKVEIK